MWGPGRKQGFGAAPGPLTKLWFTIANGNLSEVFFPRLDQPALHELRFFAGAPGSPPVDDASEAEHHVTWLQPGVPVFRVRSRHHEYELTKEFVCDPELNAILVAGSFRPDLPDVRLYVQAAPHLIPGSKGNSAQVIEMNPPLLIAHQPEDVWIAVVGPFVRASAGFYRSSDLYVELHDNDGRLGDLYERAEGGNVAVGAELGLESGPFQLAIGFAHSRPDAEEVARQALQKGAGRVRQDLELAWRRMPDLPMPLVRTSGDQGALAQASLTVLRCLEDRSQPGAFIAAPAAPWGERNHDGYHVYHLIWARDLCHIASGLLDAGDPDAALRALRHLERMQRSDGSWPQNWTLDGTPHWQGVELDQVAQPVLLAWRLGVAGHLDHDPYPTLVRQAAQFLIRHGPATPLDRWEDAGGLSPSTLAVCISALIVAGEFADDAGDHLAAAHLRAVADYWNDRVEGWCHSPVLQSYVRLATDSDAGPGPDAAVAPEFLELVRLGLRRPRDDRVLRSLDRVDALLKAHLPPGPSWRRYQGDRYGEYDGGAPWDGGGRGRPWPVLTAERAFHYLALSLPAAELARALERFAGEELLLPEQVWDAEEVPAAHLAMGEPTGSACPLGWAHAEYLRLLHAIATATFPDLIAPVRERYTEGRPQEPAYVWHHNHQIARFPAGRRVRVQLPRPAAVRWTLDEWRTWKELQAADTTLGVWVADLPTNVLAPGSSLTWTAHYMTGWEGRNFSLTCLPAATPIPV